MITFQASQCINIYILSPLSFFFYLFIYFLFIIIFYFILFFFLFPPPVPALLFPSDLFPFTCFLSHLFPLSPVFPLTFLSQ